MRLVYFTFACFCSYSKHFRMAAWYAGLLVFAHVRVSAAAESKEE
jgi:hypothetical protein